MASNSSKATQASQADDWPGRRVDMAEFSRRIAARKAKLGLPDLPRNTGNNRTQSKRALLKAIRELGGDW